MLVMFRVENYRSFGDVQKILMTAGPSMIHHDHIVPIHGMGLLTASAVLGANASGKSNLVRAMADSRAKIVDDVPIPSAAWDRNRESNRRLPTGFEYVFTTQGSVIAYGFEVVLETGEVTTEWLYDMTDAERKIFHREGREITTDVEDEDARYRLGVIMGMVREGSGDLLLPLLARLEGDMMSRTSRKAMAWFSDNLVIVGAGSHVPAHCYEGRDEAVRGTMASYDTGITGIGYEMLDTMPAEMSGTMLGRMGPELSRGAVGMVRDSQGYVRLTCDYGMVAERMVFLHNGVRFDFNEESEGTRRLCDLLPIIEPSGRSDVTFVVDDIDRSLHPHLTRRFVTDLLKMAQDCGRQLIFTTHEAMLLDTEILRRDEIWFAERASGGDTSLYSLADFKEGRECRIMASYLDGRYGAVPVFGERRPEKDSENRIRIIRLGAIVLFMKCPDEGRD